MSKNKAFMGAVARGWCSDANSGKDFDPHIAAAIVDELSKLEPAGPFLGLATTGMLLAELRARAEVDGSIEYRPVNE